MSDDVGNFEREKEIWRSLVVPILYSFCAGSAVERGVDFDGVEASGVEIEAVGGFQIFGIEGALPAVGGEGGGAEMDGWGRHEQYRVPSITLESASFTISRLCGVRDDDERELAAV